MDRLGWAAGLCFATHGLRVGIRVNDPEVLEPLMDHLPPGWKPTPSPTVDRLYSLIVGRAQANHNIRRFNLLYADLARIGRTMDLGEVFDLLRSDLHLYIAEMARRRIFVHAGVVGWREEAIVIPGRSFSGKTTLVASLIRAGATYYSDEFAVLDGRGRVHPYPQPLSIRAADGDQPRRCPAQALGGRPGVKPLPVHLILITEYRPSARWQPRPLSAGQAMLALLAHTVPVRRQPKVALDTLQQVVSHATILKSVRGEAGEMLQDLFPMLSNRARVGLLEEVGVESR